MTHFCTLFDSHYLPRGLVLYDSLAARGDDFVLHALCMDDVAYRVLSALDLPLLVPLPIQTLEQHDPELASVRAERSGVEYCWTASASLCLSILDRIPAADVITYIDADVRFYDDPAVVLDELGDRSVLVTPHRYARHFDWLERDSGRYNVQLVSFRRDGPGVAALQWWRERCLEWCYDRVEEGKYGDQRYLDDWLDRFAGVHEASRAGMGLGPWSSGRFSLERLGARLFVDGHPLVYYHFHGLRLLRRGGWASDFPLSRFEREVIWTPYVAELRAATERVASTDPELRLNLAAPLRTTGLARRLALRAPAPVPELASRTLRLASRRGRTSGGAAKAARQQGP